MDETTWRPATRDEIRSYYYDEFPDTIGNIPHWITPQDPNEFAIAFRERFPTDGDENADYPSKDFIRRNTKPSKYTNTFPDMESLIKFIQSPGDNDPLRSQENGSPWLVDPTLIDQDRPVSSAVYYGLDNHSHFWVLAFDIDAKDVARQSVATGDDSYEDVADETVVNAGIIDQPPTPKGEHSYQYTFEHVNRALKYGFELGDWLSDTVGFSEVRVFYSGQGVHVYALDTRPYYKYTMQSRRVMTEYIKETLGIPVDDNVTWDERRVIRLPTSLHADVSRIMTEITNQRGFTVDDAPKPQFITTGENE